METVAHAQNGIQEKTRTEKFGAWLCEEGPYQEFIDSLSDSNPGLRSPDPGNKDHALKPGNATVVLLEASAEGKPDFKEHGFRSSKELEKHFKTTKDTDKARRIYLVEGLAQDYISVIGGHFFMEPSFWLRQERTCVWSIKFTPTSDALPQPSLLDPEKSFQIQYCELRQFGKILPNAPIFCHRTGRHVGMTPAREEEKSTTGILRRKTSYWCRTRENGGWDVVILCDPQLHALWMNGQVETGISNSSFQKGYVDIIPPLSREQALRIPKHPHESMLRDLCHYYLHHSSLLTSEEWTQPGTASIFLKKVVVAQYLQLVDYIKAMLPSLEMRLTSGWIEEEDQWRSLQTISRRCGNYRDDIEDALISLGYAMDDPESKRKPDWKNCEKDFQYIYYRLKTLKTRADTLMQAMTGLAAIAGNRQSLDEAKRVKRLNLLALLFIPLAYTSSLFGMSDAFKPGGSDFWIYWVTSIPVIVVTVIATYCMELLLSDTNEWKLKSLLFYKKKDKTVQVRKQRRGTGIWRTSP